MEPLSAESAFTRNMDGKRQARRLDAEIGSLATRQQGVVTRAQLIEVGLGEDAIDTRLCGGRLRRLHRGVYAVGHGAISREGRWLAAVMSTGLDAVLSHLSAAALWGIWPSGELERIDVSLPRATRSREPVRRHEIRHAPDEKTRRRRIPVTTLDRTLLDLAASCSRERLETAIREAEYRHSFGLDRLEAIRRRHPGARGVRKIDMCLLALTGGPHGRPRSQLEANFAGLLARTRLPNPVLNALLDLDGFKIEADCLWRRPKLIVELDGAGPHRTRVAFEKDRERDRRLQAAGWRVIRVTWRQLDEDPEAILTDLRRLLQIEPAVTRHIDGERRAHQP